MKNMLKSALALSVTLLGCSSAEIGRDSANATEASATFELRRDAFGDYMTTLVDAEGEQLLADAGSDDRGVAWEAVEMYRQRGSDRASYHLAEHSTGWWLGLWSGSSSHGFISREGLDTEQDALEVMEDAVDALSAGPAAISDLTDLCGLSFVADGEQERIALFIDSEESAPLVLSSVRSYDFDEAMGQVGFVSWLARDAAAWRVTDDGFAIVDPQGEPVMKSNFLHPSTSDRDRRLALAQAAFAEQTACELVVAM